MSIFITLIAALIVFSAVIAIHEFGHFTVAKLCGIQVNEFSIGMGPVLWKKIYKGTQYSLRAHRAWWKDSGSAQSSPCFPIRYASTHNWSGSPSGNPA